MKHTKGPWKEMVDGYIYSEPIEGRAVGYVYGRHSSYDEEAKANANLISAAPELLEACKWALKRMLTEGEWLAMANYPARFMVKRAEQLAILESTIAKAEGANHAR